MKKGAVSASDFFYEKRCTMAATENSFFIFLLIVKEVVRSFGTDGINKFSICNFNNGMRANPYNIKEMMKLGENCKNIGLSVFTNNRGLVNKVDSLAEFIDNVNLNTKVDLS